MNWRWDTPFNIRMITSLRHKIRMARFRKSEAEQRERRRHIYQRYRNATMIPEDQFYANLDIAASISAVPGCIVECGVWRGGMSAAMAEILGPDRTYFLFDSFEGLPPARTIDGEAALKWQSATDAPGYYDNCSASISEAETTMRRSPARDVKLVKGWFQDTVKARAVEGEIALLRLDGDWYDSTMICLEQLFPKVAAGGKIIVDDYYAWDGCARAVHDYLSKHQCSERIQVMQPGIAYLTRRQA